MDRRVYYVCDRIDDYATTWLDDMAIGVEVMFNIADAVSSDRHLHLRYL